MPITIIGKTPIKTLILSNVNIFIELGLYVRQPMVGKTIAIDNATATVDKRIISAFTP
ncbi:MAG: hypothetical protein ACFFE4_20860 [Candidatus Thorarchaeota archaeon]